MKSFFVANAALLWVTSFGPLSASPIDRGDPVVIDESGGRRREVTEDYRGAYTAGSVVLGTANLFILASVQRRVPAERSTARVGAVLGLGQLIGGLFVLGSEDELVNGFAIANTMIGGVSLATNVAALVTSARAASPSRSETGTQARPALAFAGGGPTIGVDVVFD